MTDEIRDGDWTLVDHDPQLGRSVWHLCQDGFDHFRIDYQVEHLLEQNRADYNVAQTGWKGDWHKVASVPHNILHDGLDQAIQQQDRDYVKRWLNNSDNRAWRTKPGRV
jgi:hypothetical protein